MDLNKYIYDIDWLVSKINRKEKVKYLFFWGNTAAKDGTITQSCLSQWWVAPFTVEGVRYETAEHWMMAKKAELFGDQEIIPEIVNASSPAKAKKLGRQVKGFNEHLWKERCYGIVCEGNYHKFVQHRELSEFLLNTGDKVLVEASPVDAIWGIGLDREHSHAKNPRLWKGKNLLGFALMEVRDQLKNDE